MIKCKKCGKELFVKEDWYDFPVVYVLCCPNHGNVCGESFKSRDEAYDFAENVYMKTD